jgi:hypothetical protein
MLNKHLTNYKVKSFAQPLKETLAYMTGISVQVLNDNKNNPSFLDWNTTVRKCFQQLGDIGRAISPQFWVDKCLEDYTIIDDGRFENEFDRINELGGFTILMSRPGLERKDSHESENDLVSLITERAYKGRHQPPYPNTWAVLNDGSLNTLELQAQSRAKAIMWKLSQGS